MEKSVRHFFVEWVEQYNFTEKDYIALKLTMKEVLQHRCIDIYYIHEKYRVDPLSMSKALQVLSDFELIEVTGEHITASNVYDKNNVSILNYIMRTRRPSFLDGNIDWLTNHLD